MMKTVRVAVLCAVISTLASEAWAQSGGVQGGTTTNPEQFFAGLHVESAPFRRRVAFRPSVHAGAGDEMRALNVNLDFVFRPYPPGSTWEVYLGGGPSVNGYWWDEVNRLGQEVGVGGSVLVGLEHESRIFVELRIGLGNSPQSKVGVGFKFGG
jgi:hypothetical protein